MARPPGSWGGRPTCGRAADRPKQRPTRRGCSGTGRTRRNSGCPLFRSGYALNNWAALKRYLEQGYLAIDNNLSERTLRAIAVGRNNWGVLGSETGGRAAAVLYSVVGTCKHLGIDPLAYLREALPGVFALGEKPTAEQLREWLPDRWLLRRGRDSPAGEARVG